MEPLPVVLFGRDYRSRLIDFDVCPPGRGPAIDGDDAVVKTG